MLQQRTTPFRAERIVVRLIAIETVVETVPIVSHLVARKLNVRLSSFGSLAVAFTFPDRHEYCQGLLKRCVPWDVCFKKRAVIEGFSSRIEAAIAGGRHYRTSIRECQNVEAIYGSNVQGPPHVPAQTPVSFID